MMGRVVVLVDGRYLAQDQPKGLVAALRRRGCDVRLVDAEATMLDVGDDGWLRGVGLVVARGRSTATLCLLAAAEARGLPTVNRRSAVGTVHNKAEMGVWLARAGIPTPPTFIGQARALARALPSEAYPLVLKPVFGDNCRGLRVARSAGELTAEAGAEPVTLAQSYLPTRGVDLKLYVIGERVWAVRKPSPLRAPHAAPPARGRAELITPPAGTRELARRCGRLFGLELFGVDCVESDRGVLVIEVNEFPNYTAVPDADELLADHVLGNVAQEAA